MSDPRPLIAHVLYGFRVGGLENGVVNLINGLPESRYRHAVLSLTDSCPRFRARVARADVEFIDLSKPPGHGFRLYGRLAALFRELRPAVVHTRNLAALEVQVPARMAGVPVRIHGEHGWDVGDPQGTRRRYQWVRRAYRPFVTRYVALSAQLEGYLNARVGVPAARIARICNGVDARRFHPAERGREPLAGSPFNASALRVIGTVGRLQAVKDQTLLVRAFARLLRSEPQLAAPLRLCIVGDGPLRADLERTVAEAGLGGRVWLAGERDDTPEVMRALDGFVLPSRAEGISNTVLEAMASGLPVIASAVGGNPELVDAGRTGTLVPAGDEEALAAALAGWLHAPQRARAQGLAGRVRVEEGFSLDGMVARYAALYDELLAAAG
ncbi:TIGR03088 family PEP-CTERM/XrtA system glycosyltransferase [Pseudothauera nasutitermitis]|uniref:TIGR03088 family PEP-CTERM/XrtA system glycosyltransferase n=1 Tax=Pseudothauera nasutitermitis TaxID=2565930 RepID=A0A4S4AUM0_9RHOO|nr:TIGR03088 family PEP-CTERM/XrtA system glycosyltransferase [Pseudothauera nasutitermitis]THF63659.1 TIGR03088 family PEP-CTERM/XrtA system glycosyltransferase [Pseudothauera nasutitermitis]